MPRRSLAWNRPKLPDTDTRHYCSTGKGRDLKTISILDLVHDELQRVEQKMREASQVEYEHLATVLDDILKSGGKRLRPALVLLSCKFYPADPEKAISLAASVEMLHTATLVHDDMIDNSLIRRGNPTLNATWNSGPTVLAGDFLFALAAGLAAETENVRVMSIFAQSLMTICRGELRQIFNSRGHVPTREEYYQRIYSKTASLFAASTEAGAVLSGAPEPEVQVLREYGRTLGMAFQIVDDVLDFVGDERELGKPVGSDLRQGIVTLPALYFHEIHPADDALIKVLDDPREEEVRAVVAAIKEAGAVESALDEARTFAQRSQESLQMLPPNEYRQAMLDLADYVVERRW
jgi:geranylgeranyl pyrophosphate synthase